MEFVKLLLDKEGDRYFYRSSSSIKMDILGAFLLTDIRCRDKYRVSYREWIFDDLQGMQTSGNCTFLEKEGDCIYLSDLYSEEDEEVCKLKISRKQLAQLLDDWKEKVCDIKPKEVVIEYENEEFSIKTIE